MQNNYYNNNNTGEIRPASQSQIDYLIRLGFKGNTEGLTAAEASQYIKELNQANKQPQQPQPQYQPRPQQQPQPQQAPQMQNNMPVKVEEFNPIITTRNGEELMLSKDIVDSYITSSGQPLTDTEYKYFFSVCKTYGLNPFLKDIYAIKFGTQPATFVIDYKVLQMACYSKDFCYFIK